MRAARALSILAALSVALAVVAAAVAVLVLRAGAGQAQAGRGRTATAVRVLEVLELPSPRTDGDVSLEEALEHRSSVREFTDAPLALADLGQLLWAAQGERGGGGRTAPSAGGLFPLELYVAHEGGVYHYRPAGHEVALVSGRDVRGPLAVAGLDQRALRGAPAVVVIAGVQERSAVKYGDRAEPYVLIEAGHAAQNLLLQASVLGLGAVPTGAFRDGEVHRLLGLPAGTEPLYLIPAGHPEAP